MNRKVSFEIELYLTQAGPYLFASRLSQLLRTDHGHTKGAAIQSKNNNLFRGSVR